MLRFDTPLGLLETAVTALTIAGWTGRDRAAVQHHIDELAEIGVPAPSAVPLFYRAAPALLTQEAAITVLGPDTSGEAEPFLLRAHGRLWLGLASDHTDRGLEAHSVAHSKQICAKPVAGALWSFDAVADRLDTLHLSTCIDGGAALYQDGPLARILPLADLLEQAPLADGEAMLCGTLPAIGGVRPAADYAMALEDAETGDALRLTYRVDTVPVIA